MRRTGRQNTNDKKLKIKKKDLALRRKSYIYTYTETKGKIKNKNNRIYFTLASECYLLTLLCLKSFFFFFCEFQISIIINKKFKEATSGGTYSWPN